MKFPKKYLGKASAVLALFLMVGLAICVLPGESSESVASQKNVTIDLPSGGKAVVGEIIEDAPLLGGMARTTFNNIVVDIPDLEKGTVEKIIVIGNAREFSKLTKMDRIEIINVNLTSFHADSLVYEGLELDIPLLLSMNPENPKPEDLKKLAQGFRLKSSEIVNFTSQDGASFFSVARSGAGPCSATRVENTYTEGIKGGVNGLVTFSMDKSGAKVMEFPNILRIFDAGEDMDPRDVANILDGIKIRDFIVEGLSINMGDGGMGLEKLAFNVTDDDAEGNLSLQFTNLAVPKEFLSGLGLGNVWNREGPMLLNGNAACNFTDKGDVISADQDIALSARDFLSANYRARTMLNMKNHGIVNEKADLLLEDKGMVESLPLPMKMFLLAQAMQVDPAVGQGVRLFLESPGKTMRVGLAEKGGDTEVTVDVD